MKGNIIGFDPDTNTGAISGHDGNRYDFATQDWHGRSPPRRGDVVDFQVDGARAHAIYRLEPEYVPPRFWQFYFSPAARISRSQYWLRFMVPYLVIFYGLYFAQKALDEESPGHAAVSAVDTIFVLAALWPSIAVLVKRIHDRNKSGWLCLALYVPVVLFVVLLTVWFTKAIMMTVARGDTFVPPTLDALGVTVIVFGVISAAVALWFFVEFGCLRGTVGANRFGPDPVR